MAIALRDRFDGVVGVDMSAETQRQAEGAGVDAIEWRVTAAAEIDDALGDFRLVVISNALHWIDQQAVLAHCYERVTPGDGIAHLTHGQSIGQTAVAQPWQRTISKTIPAWLGPRRRAGSSYYEQPAGSEEEMLVDAGFTDAESGSVTIELDWDVDHVLGYLSSTSYAGRQTLGADHEGFRVRSPRATAPCRALRPIRGHNGSRVAARLEALTGLPAVPAYVAREAGGTVLPPR